MVKTSRLLQENRRDGAPSQSMPIVHCERSELFTVLYQEASVGDGSAIEVLIVPNGTQVPRVRLSGAVGGDAEVFVSEGPTVTDNGTPLTFIGRNRSLSPVPVALTSVFSAPTVTDDGTPLAAFFIPGGTKKESIGSPLEEREWILSASLNYLLRLTNNSGGVATLSIQIDLVEPA